MEFFLLLLSVPFFYILGIIQFVTWITRKNKQNYFSRASFLRKVIHELTSKQNKSTKEILDDYKTELKAIPDQEKSSAEYTQFFSATAPTKPPVEKSIVQKDIGEVWSNWYSNNTIDLILYIGAFLIVMSASIFVGFQWETISGVFKAMILTFCALGFLISGLIFHQIPKIKNAGSTFIAIGALLIPICGSAWYTFVLKPEGIGPGLVWFMTSLIAICVYVFLAFNFKSTFYVYITSISSLSLTLSLVNIFNLQKDFYILASIMTSFILLIASIIAKKQKKNFETLLSTPLEISSDIMLPASLLFGFITALMEQKLYTGEAVLSVLLAAVFYLFSYYYTKHPWRICAALVLFPIGIFLSSRWLLLENTVVFYTLDIIGTFYILFSEYFKRIHRKEESDVTIFLGFGLQIAVFLFAFSSDTDPFRKAVLSLYPGLGAILIAYLRKNIQFTIFSSVFLAIFSYLYYFDVLLLSKHPEYLSIFYLSLGVISYAVIHQFKNSKDFVQSFGISATIFFILSMFFSFQHREFMLFNCVVIAGVQTIAAFTFKQPGLLYGASAFIYLALYLLLDLTSVSFKYFPLAFAGISYLLYIPSIVIKNELKEPYRFMSLIGSLVTPIFFGISGFLDREIEVFALATLYGATILYGIDWQLKKVLNFGYVVSVMGMATFLWQIHFVGITEILVYSTSLGIYFMILAYTRKIKNDISSMEGLDVIGLLLLLTPPVFLSFSDEVVKHTMILGIFGIILLFLGISVSYKRYKYAGVFGIVFAVLPHTYNYIFALPRWLIVAILGFAFLGVGISLLLRRKE